MPSYKQDEERVLSLQPGEEVTVYVTQYNEQTNKLSVSLESLPRPLIAWKDIVADGQTLGRTGADGEPAFELRRDECSQAFLSAYDAYVVRTRTKLKELPPSSRGWWKLSSTLSELGLRRAFIH